MRTLSQLKKDLYVGRKVKLTYAKFAHKYLNVEREVTESKSNHVSIGGSYLDWPPASLLEYDDGPPPTFSIYDIGLRELTASEANVLANRPENAKQVEIDCMSDGSIMYRADKLYFKELHMEYLEGLDFHGGLKYNYQGKVQDKSLKGDLMLRYEIL